MNAGQSILACLRRLEMDHERFQQGGAAHEMTEAADAIEAALALAEQYAGIDGEHHKTWVIDQMVRALTGSGYAEWVAAQKAGEDGPETYDWDEGIAP